jgi:hypothetical protein
MSKPGEVVPGMESVEFEAALENQWDWTYYPD